MQKLTGWIFLAGKPDDDADVRYATGFSTPDSIMVLIRGRRRHVLVPGLELDRAKREMKGADVVCPADLGLSRMRRNLPYAQACAFVARVGVKRVRVPSGLPVGIADGLRKAGVKVVVERGAIFPGRRIKTLSEVRLIAKTQRAAVAAMRAARDLIASAKTDGRGRLRIRGRLLTSEAVRRVINRVLSDHDCTGTSTIVSCGRQAALPHERGHGPLMSGVPIVVDIFPRNVKTGYWGDLTRTFVHGVMSWQVAAMYRAVRAAHRSALAVLRPGASGAMVHVTAVRELERRGFVTRQTGRTSEGFIHGTGHGIGLDVHEVPSLSSQGGPLRVGDVVTVEPGLYYPRIGGVRIEDTVVLTRSGWRFLARCSYSPVLGRRRAR